jgi:ribonuclease-3
MRFWRAGKYGKAPGLYAEAGLRQKDSSTMDGDKLRKVERAVGHEFSDRELLRTALTHSSYANEWDSSLPHNERLEFLGDAVLELSVSHELFQRYPHAREGDLTRLRARLVSEPSLAELARDIALQQHILLGKGEESQGGRDRDAILCDCLEAVLGAVFLDAGFERAREVILALFINKWPACIQKPRKKDYKSRLQEITQKMFKARPTYTLQDSYGPEHAKIYRVKLELPDGTTFEAEDSSVKKAEQQAARFALQSLDRSPEC